MKMDTLIIPRAVELDSTEGWDDCQRIRDGRYELWEVG